jgi:hypothetical protein
MKDTILSILRHALTFGGGILASKGFISEDTATQAVGAIIALAGVIYGAYDEYRASKKAK